MPRMFSCCFGREKKVTDVKIEFDYSAKSAGLYVSGNHNFQCYSPIDFKTLYNAFHHTIENGTKPFIKNDMQLTVEIKLRGQLNGKVINETLTSLDSYHQFLEKHDFIRQPARRLVR